MHSFVVAVDCSVSAVAAVARKDPKLKPVVDIDQPHCLLKKNPVMFYTFPLNYELTDLLNFQLIINALKETIK